MKGVLNFVLVLVCVESLILELGADSSSSTMKRPPAMAEPTSGEFNKFMTISLHNSVSYNSKERHI